MNDKEINTNKRKGGNSKPNRKRRIIIISSAILALFLFVLLCGYFLGDRAGVKFSITDIFSPIKANPQLQKDSSGEYTNVLFVGIDARSYNSGLQNTDTIMINSYNHKTHETTMLSIPRDFFVKVPDQGHYSKINGIYAIGERKNPGHGLEYLQGVVEDITGKEIQYYGMVNLQGFVELIDTLGGVEVDVENSFTDHRYPVEGAETRYQTISFQKGPQIMDGKTALRFVRSRYSMDAGEGSDFARARRQQRVITGVKDELLSSSTFLNPKKILNILNVLDKNIEYTTFTNEEIQAAVKIFQKENMHIHSFVLDPSIANYKLVTDRGLDNGLYTIIPTAGLNNYEYIRKYLTHAYEKPRLYSEEPTILIYDVGISYEEGLEKTTEFQNENPYVKIQYMGSLMTSIQKNYIYRNNDEEEVSELDKEVANTFSINMTRKPQFMQGETTNGDYIILLGKND